MNVEIVLVVHYHALRNDSLVALCDYIRMSDLPECNRDKLSRIKKQNIGSGKPIDVKLGTIIDS